MSERTRAEQLDLFKPTQGQDVEIPNFGAHDIPVQDLHLEPTVVEGASVNIAERAQELIRALGYIGEMNTVHAQLKLRQAGSTVGKRSVSETDVRENRDLARQHFAKAAGTAQLIGSGLMAESEARSMQGDMRRKFEHTFRNAREREKFKRKLQKNIR